MRATTAAVCQSESADLEIVFAHAKELSPNKRPDLLRSAVELLRAWSRMVSQAA